MDLSRVIIGPVVTEKAERLKAGAATSKSGSSHTYTLRVAPWATKIDVKNALKLFYDVETSSVRMIRTQGKTRLIGAGQAMEKRSSFKKALVTLAARSKPLDVSAFQVISS